jgi:4-hydroxybutyrate dehydrogenase
VPISYLTTIHLEEGAVRLLPSECARLGVKRPLLVTDPGVRRAGILDAIPGAGAMVLFDATPANPTEAAVRAAVELYRAEGCDGVVAVGGGSSMDLGKGVALAATHDGPLRQYALVEGGVSRITPATAPVIAVPTTSGTGSEVGRAAVIILDDGRKLALLSPHVIPKSAICDPELTYGLPPLLTAATGMDALSHCFETFMAPSFNPPADAIALDGLRRGWRSIEQATRSPRDRDARRDMMTAALEGALAFQKGLGCVHSLSHALGGLEPRLHHGTLNAVLLPAVIRFNGPSPSLVAEDKLVRMGAAIGTPGDADAIATAVADLNVRLGLPLGLGALGVREELFPRIVAGALSDHCHATNPRIASAEDYSEILAASL